MNLMSSLHPFLNIKQHISISLTFFFFLMSLALSILRQSPIQVLTRPDPAQLWRSYKIRHIQGSMAIELLHSYITATNQLKLQKPTIYKFYSNASGHSTTTIYMLIFKYYISYTYILKKINSAFPNLNNYHTLILFSEQVSVKGSEASSSQSDCGRRKHKYGKFTCQILHSCAFSGKKFKK